MILTPKMLAFRSAHPVCASAAYEIGMSADALQTPRDSCLGEFLEAEWLPHIKAAKASWTIDTNIAKNHILPYFASKPLGGITEDDVRSWLVFSEKRPIAQSTRNRRLHVLKSIMRLALTKGILDMDPTARVHARPVKKTHWPSLEDARLEALLSALARHPDRKAKALALILLTGAGKREVLNARWENLSLEEGVLLVPRPKGLSPRKIRLSAHARRIFRSIPRQDGSPWIFPGRDDSAPLSDIFLFWKELRASLDLGGISIRDLRYVFADWQLRSGLSPLGLHYTLGEKGRQMFHAQRDSQPAPADGRERRDAAPVATCLPS